MRNKIALPAIFVFIIVAVSGVNGQNSEFPDIGSFSKKKMGADRFFRVGRIERIVIPETTESSLIAGVDKIVFSSNGSIYIGDYFSQKAIFRFDDQGKFLAKYGKLGQGPGEYNYLMGFSVDSQGRIFILSDLKIILYNGQGKLIKEVKIDYLGRGLEYIHNEVFARILQSRGMGKEDDHLFNVYNDQLEKQRAIFPNEGRLKKYMFLPRSSMAIWRGCLLYGDVYNLALTMHDPIKDRSTRWTFSDENRKFAAAWKKPTLDEDDRTIIKKNIRRFESIYASETKIYLIETKRDEGEVNLWAVDPAGKSIAVFPYLELIGSREQKSSALRFDYLAGAYQNGMVFVIEDEKKFKAVQDRYPQFRDLKFGLNENPALIYIRFD